MQKAQVDQEKCIGCGMCASLCPKVFKLMEDGKSHVISDNCGDCDCKQAAENCSVGAISIEET